MLGCVGFGTWSPPARDLEMMLEKTKMCPREDEVLETEEGLGIVVRGHDDLCRRKLIRGKY